MTQKCISYPGLARDYYSLIPNSRFMSTTTSQILANLHGQPILLFRLQNKTGSYIEITNYGATLISIVVPDSKGDFGNIVLAYDNIESYFSDNSYLGSTIGRFANRIANARFSLNGKTCLLEKNDGENTNHGGFSGWHKKIWDWEEISSGIRFICFSPDGEGGYPGNVKMAVDYIFDEDNTLRIKYAGITDAPTYLNLTNHTYFNLSGNCTPVLDHQLYIPSTEILETTCDCIPTGAYVNVKDTPFDFTSMHSISDYFYEGNQQLKWNRGYNHCYVLKKKPSPEMQLAARLSHPASGRRLTVETSFPGMLLYTAGYLESKFLAKNKKPLSPNTGVCFETQFFPDTPSHTHFPSCLLNPGEKYSYETTYHFEVDKY